jgi:hypothetical protein
MLDENMSDSGDTASIVDDDDYSEDHEDDGTGQSSQAIEQEARQPLHGPLHGMDVNNYGIEYYVVEGVCCRETLFGSSADHIVAQWYLGFGIRFHPLFALASYTTWYVFAPFFFRSSFLSLVFECRLANGLSYISGQRTLFSDQYASSSKVIGSSRSLSWGA